MPRRPIVSLLYFRGEDWEETGVRIGIRAVGEGNKGAGPIKNNISPKKIRSLKIFA